MGEVVLDCQKCNRYYRTTVMTDITDHPPHRNLYTRIKVSPSKGVGIFAIRDIPAGLRLFVGDFSETVLVSRLDVERIVDPEIRRMYTDFCPLIDGSYVAPVDFNQITMGWYLNHSDLPNVKVLRDLQFVTSRFIPRGEELTTDYRIYSQRALTDVQAWNASECKDN